MRKSVITVAYRIVRGKAKKFQYWGAKLYRTRKRKDGIYTFRPCRELGTDRRSYKLACQDAKTYCRKMKYGFYPNIRLGSHV